MRLPERALKFPITTILLFVTLGGVGFISLRRLGLELFPNVGYPTAAIVTPYVGVGPFEVESSVSRPLEEAVSTISGVEKVRSTSEEGFSLVIVNFTWGTDMAAVVPEIREKISAIESDLPEGVDRSRIFKFNPQVLPVFTFTVSTPVEDTDVRRMVEKTILPEIERQEGVASASVYGGRKSAVTCRLDLDAIAEKQIPVTQILQAFGGENVNLPGGSMRLADRHLVLRTIGEFSSVEDIGNVLVGYRDGVAVFLKDVAEVSLDYLPQEEYVRAARPNAVLVEVQKMEGRNTVEVISRVKAAIRGLKETLPPSVEIHASTDQSVSILESITGLTDAAWQGGLLAVLVLVFFLRNTRSILIVSLSIPVSIIATFTLMNFAHIDLNIMSLAGLTLGVGMFVDNSIVVLEVIFRKLLAGMEPREAARVGASEVTMAVVASTLTNVIVFLPLVFIKGLANLIMRDLAWTLSFSMIVSLVMSLTIVPVLCARFLRLHKGATVTRRELTAGAIDLEISLADVEVKTGVRPLDWLAGRIQRIIRWMDDAYERVLGAAVRRGGLVIGVAVALFGLSVAAIVLLGMEFLPDTDEGRFTIGVETRVESPYTRTEETVRRIEDILHQELGRDLVSLTSIVGRSSGTRLGQTGSHLARISVNLVPKDRRSRSIWTIISASSAAIRNRVMDVKITSSVDSIGSIVNLASGSESPIVAEISGDDLDRSAAWAGRVAGVMRAVPGTRDVQVSYKTGKPEVQFRVKRREAASLGVSPLEIAATIRAAYKGMEVSRYSAGGDSWDVTLILREADRNSLQRVGSLFLVNRAGTRIPLENVVDIVPATGPVSVERVNKTRMVTVTGALTGEVPLNKVMDGVRAGVAGLGSPPAGVKAVLTGASSQMRTAFRDLLFALLLGVGLVYVVMANQFESLLHPFIVMFSIPFGLIGLVTALLVTGTTFSLVAFIGAILLVGYVVNNGILLVDYINHLRKSGMALAKAVAIGGRTRLKPILMSTATTLLGLLPMALGLGTGAELRAPMARAVFGGLLSSTVITLILIPTMYYLVERARERRVHA
jgi:hydrophobic/amphiphilic exporter-1 (mainly G- bacteria), HAE1 family